MRSCPPFAGAGDTSHREIPRHTPVDQIEFGVGSYDHTDVNSDPNVMLPIDRLEELITSGTIGNSVEAHVGFNGGGGDLERLRSELAPVLIDRLKAMHADAVIFTGG